MGLGLGLGLGPPTLLRMVRALAERHLQPPLKALQPLWMRPQLASGSKAGRTTSSCKNYWGSRVSLRKGPRRAGGPGRLGPQWETLQKARHGSREKH